MSTELGGMIRRRIEVTDSDILDGEPCVGDQCPLKLALERAIPLGNWSVGSCSAWLQLPPAKSGKIVLIEIGLPLPVIQWRRDFDVDGIDAVTPIAFTVLVPAELF